MLQTVDELDKDLIARYTYPALDGITDVDRFYKAKYKILWILKEANWDSEQVCPLRGFHKNVTTYPNWRRTYKPIIQISHAMLNGIYDYKLIPTADKIAEVMHDIAFINVKKVAGGASSDWNVINQHYTDNKDFLHFQIEKISPNIIINCSGINQLFRDFSLKSNHPSTNKFAPFQYSFDDNSLIINAYHPNQRWMTHDKYFDAIAEIRKLSGR